MTTKKTQNFDDFSSKNGVFYKHVLLHKGTSTLFGDDSEAEILNFYLLKKVFFLVSTKKPHKFDGFSSKNGVFYKHLLLVEGTYGQCAYMYQKS